MKIPVGTILEDVISVTYNGESTSKKDFTNPDGKYHQAFYESTLSELGIKQIGKTVKSFEVFVADVGWFRCEC